MRYFVFLLVVALASPAQAQGKVLVLSEARVLEMLHGNTVVQAAVAQGRWFSGAKACQYAVRTSQPAGFEVNTAYDYEASITCGKDRPSAAIAVTGRWLPDGPQPLKLAIDFAGRTRRPAP